MGEKAESYPGKPGVAPVVEVRDDLDRPVEGAEVAFELPMTGSGGYFPNLQRQVNSKTNHQGQATSGPFTTSTVTGPFTIRVTAKYRELSQQTSIVQFVATRPRSTEAILRPKSSAKKWILVGVVIAGAAAGGITYGLLQGGGSHPVTIHSSGGAIFGQP